MKFSHSSLAHKSTAMRLNALLPAQISDTSFDNPTKALCTQTYLPVKPDDDDGPETCATYEQILFDDNSFTHSGHFYSAPSSPLPLRGAPDYSTDTVSEFHAETHRQLQVKNLPKVPR